MTAIAIPVDLISPEFKLSFADLDDELTRLKHTKDELSTQFKHRLDEVSAVLVKRAKEEDEAIGSAKKLMDKEEYEAALKALEKVLHDRL